MKKRHVRKLMNRESATGKFVIKSDRRGEVIATVSGVSRTAPSVRRAKSLVKVTATYYKNYEFIVRNNRNETDSVISVNTKSQSSLEYKYRNIEIKKM